MRYLEVRRHSMSVTTCGHLSQAGVDLARSVGSALGPFARVITSSDSCAYETAIAMGFAVDEQVDWLSIPYDEYLEEMYMNFPYQDSFADYAGLEHDFCREQANHWISVVRRCLRENETALLIADDEGIIEMGTVGCLRYFPYGDPVDFAEWGPILSCCEGVRIGFDNSWKERCIFANVLRLTPEQSNIVEQASNR